MSKQNIAVLFGGESAEHDVSVITGLQVMEQIDRKQFNPLAIKVNQQGEFWYYPKLKKRQDYKKIKPQQVTLIRKENTTYLQRPGMLQSDLPLTAAYLAFHGGKGENGAMQGLLEVFNLPFTSPDSESSSLGMNKVITKQILEAAGYPQVPYLYFAATDIEAELNHKVKHITDKLELPVIVKPAHLGSSIGINIAHTTEELSKYLSAASLVDKEVLVERLIPEFTEYNVAVRQKDNELEVSAIEHPLAQDEILSFADKYERGGKKSGGDGMASLSRELPTNIEPELRDKLYEMARDVFKHLRCKGMIRIDFMVTPKQEIYITEPNTIPGSMSYYLWEASGISFTQQITDLLEQAVSDHKQASKRKLTHQSDIVDKFTAAKEN